MHYCKKCCKQIEVKKLGIPTIFDRKLKFIRDRMNQIDVNEDGLDPEDPTGAVLLKSLGKIDNEVKMKNFGGSGRGQSREESEVDSTKTSSQETLNVKVDVNVKKAIENAEQNETTHVKAEKQLGDD